MMWHHQLDPRQVGWLLLVVALLSGCNLGKPGGGAASAPVPGTPRYYREQAAKAGRASAIPASIPPPRHVHELNQQQNGPGIVICDPTATPRLGPLRDFGAGCARWLHFQVGGHAEFGQTPLWDSAQRTIDRQYRLGKPQTLSEAAGFYDSLGITHVAVGRIDGSEQRCTLEYQLYELPDKKPIGAPLKAVGTYAEVTAQLPQIARQLTIGLGVKEPRVAERVVETPADLQFLGWLPGTSFAEVTPDQEHELERLSRTSPLGAVLYTLDAQNVGLDEVAKRGQHLMSLAPDNPVAWGVVGTATYVVRGMGHPIPMHGVEQALEKYPKNYQLRTTLAMLASRTSIWDRTRYLQEEAARCATGNPFAWSYLREALYGESDRTRHGRTINEMTPEEWKKVSELYPYLQEVSQRLVDLDPTVGGHWLKLSSAAAFAGDGLVADKAYWKAVQLQAPRIDLYFWGLEMYQPKWYGDPVKLQKVAQLVLKDNFTTSVHRLSMARALHRANLSDAKGPLYLRVLRTAEERHQMSAFVKGEQHYVYAASENRHRVQRKKKRIGALTPVRPAPSAPSIRPVASYEGGVTALAGAPDLERVAAGGGNGEISVASADGEVIARLSGHTGPVRGLAWSPDGKLLASSSSDRTLRIWDPEAGYVLLILEGHRCRVLSVAWHPQTGRLLSGGEDGTLREWDPTTGKNLRTIKGLGGEVKSLAYSPNGALLAVSTGDPENTVTLRDGKTLALRHTLNKAPHLLHALAWRADSSRLATASGEGIHLWTPETGALAQTIPLPDYLAMSLAWGPDGAHLLYLGGDRMFHMTDAASGKELLEGAEVSNHANLLLWDAEAGWALTGGADGNLLRWTTEGLLQAPTPQKVAATGK